MLMVAGGKHQRGIARNELAIDRRDRTDIWVESPRVKMDNQLKPGDLPELLETMRSTISGASLSRQSTTDWSMLVVDSLAHPTSGLRAPESRPGASVRGD